MIITSEVSRRLFAAPPKQAPAVAGALYPALYSPLGRQYPVYMMHDQCTGTVVMEDQDLAPEDRKEKFGDRLLEMNRTHPFLQLWIGELELVQE